MRNPKGLIKGDRIIVKKSRNGAPTGVVLEINASYTNYYSVKDTKNLPVRTYTVYCDGNPNDDFVIANRKDMISYARESIKEIKKELLEAQIELERLEKFETDEDEVAHKLSMILKAKDDPKAIAEILKELKKSDYL